MRILVLSRGPEVHSTRRLVDTARNRGHSVRVLDTMGLSIAIEDGRPRLYYGGEKLAAPDVVVPRIGSSITFYGCAVVRQFEAMGVFVLNAAEAINISRDKLRSFQVLSRHNIPMPATHFVRTRESVAPTMARLGNAPIIIKLLEGTQGVGVILAETQRTAQAIVETLLVSGQNVLLQAFVKEAKGRDVRAFVIGGRVVAAMRRVADGDEFRSNLHRGGRAERVELTEEYERTAVRAAQVMGLRVAGVDMLESNDGPLILEVNSSPGLEGIERTTEIDVATEVIRHIEDVAQFPQVDLNLRFGMGDGYGIGELTIGVRSELVDRTLGDLALGERDVRVLSVTRGSLVTPNPGAGFRFVAGDHVFCYGKQLVLQELFVEEPAESDPRSTSH